MKSGDRLTFSPILNEEVSAAPQVPLEGIWSYIHSLLQSDGEGADLEGLLSLLSWFGLLES